MIMLLLSSKCQCLCFLEVVFKVYKCIVNLYLAALLCILTYMLEKSFKCK